MKVQSILTLLGYQFNEWGKIKKKNWHDPSLHFN